MNFDTRNYNIGKENEESSTRSGNESGLSSVENQVNELLNKIEFKQNYAKKVTHDQIGTGSSVRRPPNGRGNGVRGKKVLGEHNNSVSINCNSRTSGVSEGSVDLLEKGFFNFYRENKNNSSFVNVGGHLGGGYYCADDVGFDQNF